MSEDGRQRGRTPEELLDRLMKRAAVVNRAFARLDAETWAEYWTEMESTTNDGKIAVASRLAGGNWELLIQFLNSIRGKAPASLRKAAAVYAVGRDAGRFEPPVLAVKESSPPIGLVSLELKGSSPLYWFAFVIFLDGRIEVPPFFRDSDRRFCSRSLARIEGPLGGLSLTATGSGTAYALASTHDFLPEPVSTASDLPSSLLRGVRELRAKRRPLFLMESPFELP